MFFAASRAQAKLIREAERLYLRAAEAAGNGSIKRMILAQVPELEDEEKVQMSLVGVAEDGKKIYEGNFPKGTPKAAKSERILDYIRNVWSKEPISLVISNGETSRTIQAQFDPTIDETQNTPTDASKLAGGNRHGTSSEQRVTLDLADDYYEIASDAKYNYSKEETGKEIGTHNGVNMWHYFVNDIYFAEYGDSEHYEPYTVTINVKEKDNGEFVYSFNAEKEPSTRRTLHADVNTRKGANGELFLDNSISQNSEKSTETAKKVSDGGGKVQFSRKAVAERDTDYLAAVKSGDMDTARRMVEEAARDAGYTEHLYHGTQSFGFTVLDDSKFKNAAFYTAPSTNATRWYAKGNDTVRRISDRNGEDTTGNYELYGNTEGMLHVQCFGETHDRLDPFNIPAASDPSVAKYVRPGQTRWNTAQIATWANDNGYKGVVFHQILEAGGVTDFYAFFKPQEQVKSADPVTYDDNGAVIPLSERFDATKNELRFSRKVDPEVAEAHREAAVERFGITNDFREAGFVLPDGSMLDFSGGIKGRRGDDHGKVRLIYDEELSGSQAIARFLSEGNVRISELARGIEIGEGDGLTVSQYNVISRFISHMRGKGDFYVDYTREDGSEIGSATYKGNVSAEEVIWDIKEFYRSGEVRDPSSEVYFSRKQNDTGNQTIDSQEGIDTYTEEQYNNFGWVRDNDILSKESMAEFTSKFADAKKRRHVYPKNKRGEFMIAIEGEVKGVDNIIVFASGEIESPKISKVVSIFEYDGTELDKVRRIIYGAERRGVQPKAGNVCNIYFSTDFGYYEYQQRSVKASDQDREQLGEQRRGDRKTTEGAEGSEVTDDDVVFSRKQQTTDDSDRASRELTMADLRAMDARDAQDGPEIKKTGYTYDDVHGILDSIKKESLAFETASGVVEGKIFRREGWDLGKRIYEALKMGELGNKREIARKVASMIVDTAMVNEKGSSKSGVDGKGTFYDLFPKNP